MREGYTVENSKIEQSDNCILVDNYHVNNEVFHLPIKIEHLSFYKDKYSIGVWRIKNNS